MRIPGNKELFYELEQLAYRDNLNKKEEKRKEYLQKEFGKTTRDYTGYGKRIKATRSDGTTSIYPDLDTASERLGITISYLAKCARENTTLSSGKNKGVTIQYVE